MGGKTITYEWQWRLKSSPQELWPLVSDTKRFDQAAQLPTVEFSEIPMATGGSRRFGRSSKFGVEVEWEEYPYEWIREQEYSIVRVFKQGPLLRTFNRMFLEPLDGGTLIKYSVEVTPANFVGRLGTYYQVGWESRRNFERVFLQIDDFIQKQQPKPFNLLLSAVTNTGWRRLVAGAERLVARGFDRRWVGELVELISNEPDLNLLRMRPYAVAESWGAPRRQVLELFLSATRLGLLSLHWDVLCPLCREAKGSSESLQDLARDVHCRTCNIDYSANFSRNVEVSFTPHPQIRTLSARVTCIGGPMVTPHIEAQQRLEPGEARTISVVVAPGRYRVRTQRPEVNAWVDINNDSQVDLKAGSDRIEVVQSTPGGANSPELATGPASAPALLPGRLTVTNEAPYHQTIYLERGEWYADAATADVVTTLQLFRDLFGEEVLRPHEQIAVEGMSILFSDLVGSTALYDREGDAPSYALVREQFEFLRKIIREHEGGIVKTIGDSIMAAFTDPAQGLRAALTIQESIPAFNQQQPATPLTLRLGLHFGPCIAVNLNGRLDYFGTTVNIAARLEGQSRGGDVVISDIVWRDVAVQDLLKTYPLGVERFKTAIKGFDEDFVLYRLMLDVNSPTNSGASKSTPVAMSSPK